MSKKQQFTSVWDAIEDTPAAAENMKLRSSLVMILKNHIVSTGLSQSEAAKLFGVTQPRVSDLMRGKINLFTIDTLINMAASAGLYIEICVRKADTLLSPEKQTDTAQSQHSRQIYRRDGSVLSTSHTI